MGNEAWLPSVLRDFVDVKHGFAFEGDYFTDRPARDVLLTPGNFAVNGGFKDEKLKYYIGPVPDDYVLATGDLIVTMTDLSKESDTLGYPALVPGSPGKRYLHNQRLGKVVILNDKELDKLYLYYLLRTREYRNEILASASGSVIKHTAPDRIRMFQFLRPSLPEQRAIADVLGALDNKIELNRRMNCTLEEMARALFKEWFVDRAKEEWDIKPVGDLATIVGGTTPSTKEPAYWEDGVYHWATPKDLSALQTTVLLDTERKVTAAGLAQIGSGLLPAGTVLLSSRAPIGYLAIAEIPVAINQGFIAMKPNGRVSNLFLLLWAEYAHAEILSRANGSTFLEISKSNFRPIPVIVPDEAYLRRFDDIVGPLYARIVQNEKQSHTLATILGTLLPKLISGELRVKNADAFARGVF